MVIVMFQFREKRIEQEKELVQKQNTWLSDELKTKTDELGKMRKEKVIFREKIKKYMYAGREKGPYFSRKGL